MKCLVHAVCGVLLLGACIVEAQESTAETVAPLVLGRGPIHEAFAEVVAFDPSPGIVAPRKPPEPIQELPPKTRPAGERVQWIPGYWAWDDERTDFIWVSGGWRNAPPNRRWIPGYWSDTSNGYQWVSGFWEAESTAQIEYLPAPPASLEEGANSSAPSPDHFWVPGSWIWRDASYAWRPGFWWRTSPGWIWIPAHYRYTPIGIVWVRGYWDYELTGRGHLYAPVYYPRPVYIQPGFYYRPTSLVDFGLLTASLFIHPNHHHYYYGDYYATRYGDLGYHPWYRYGSVYRGYDPLFSYYAWQHRRRNDLNWRDGVEREFVRRRDQPNLRPPRVIERGAVIGRGAKPIVRTAQNAATDRDSEIIEARATEIDRESIEQMRRLRRDRREAENAARRDTAQSPPVVPRGERDRVQRRPTQPPNRSGETTTGPRAEKPRGDVPRWRVPESGVRVAPAAAGGDRIQAPARPQLPKKRSPAVLKSGPKTRLPKIKPKSKKE